MIQWSLPPSVIRRPQDEVCHGAERTPTKASRRPGHRPPHNRSTVSDWQVEWKDFFETRILISWLCVKLLQLNVSRSNGGRQDYVTCSFPTFNSSHLFLAGPYFFPISLDSLCRNIDSLKKPTRSAWFPCFPIFFSLIFSPAGDKITTKQH